MHVAFIMDGNRRYAKRNALARIFGHKSGVQALARVLQAAPKLGIDTITVYALSTENVIKRSQEEVEDIFKVMVDAAKEYKETFIGNNIRAKVMGNLKALPQKFSEIIQSLEKETEHCTGQLLQICIGYGGRDEIARAVKKAVDNGEEINEETISKYLDSSLEPDLIVRTGGDRRLSNFLLWQGSYSELYFTDTLWPDFDEKELKKAVESVDPDRINKGK